MSSTERPALITTLEARADNKTIHKSAIIELSAKSTRVKGSEQQRTTQGWCTCETADVEGAQRPNTHHMRSNGAFTAPAPSTAEAIQTLSMAKARLASTAWWPKTSIAAAWITPFTTAPRILTGEGLRWSLWGTGCRACAICP